MRSSPLISVALALLAVSSPASAELVKLALVMGNNRGGSAERSLRFAERDATKFRDVLVEVADVEPRNVSLLLGETAASARRALQALELRARALRRDRPGVGTLLIFYYSGHANGRELELGTTNLSFAELVGALRASQADVRLAFVDSCRSGQLVAAKGGRVGRPYQIRVTEEAASRGYAIITSSAEDELSQESAEIRGSFFTHHLVSALRGAADETRDGSITLGEAYRYAYLRTVAGTTTTVGGSQHPMYDFRLAGRGDIVLARTGGRRSSVTVTDAAAPGRLAVLDARSEVMIAESQLAPGSPARLVLSPGRYQLFLLRHGSTRRASLALAAGEHVVVRERDFTRHALRGAVAKGGLFRRSWRHQLGAGFLVRRALLQGGAAMGASLHYLVEPAASWQGVARLSWSTAPDAGLSTGFHDLAVHGGLRYRLAVAGMGLHGGVLLGYEHLLQGERAGLSRHTSAFDYLGVLGAEWPIGSVVLHADGGVGGCLFRLREGGTTHRLDLQLVVGVGWQWGVER
jgi:hypothetical protein